MTATPRPRSIHINAPVEKVFDHVKDPNNFVAADPEPNPTGTTLSLTFAISTKISLANKVLNWVFSNQARQLDKMLASYKKSLQS